MSERRRSDSPEETAHTAPPEQQGEARAYEVRPQPAEESIDFVGSLPAPPQQGRERAYVKNDTVWRCPNCGERWLEDGEGAQDMLAECGVCGVDMEVIGKLSEGATMTDQPAPAPPEQQGEARADRTLALRYAIAVAEGAKRGKPPEVVESIKRHIAVLRSLIRPAPPQQGREPRRWEVRNEGMGGGAPYAIERGTGRSLELFLSGIEDQELAGRIAARLNRVEASALATLREGRDGCEKHGRPDCEDCFLEWWSALCDAPQRPGLVEDGFEVTEPASSENTGEDSA